MAYEGLPEFKIPTDEDCKNIDEELEIFANKPRIQRLINTAVSGGTFGFIVTDRRGIAHKTTICPVLKSGGKLDVNDLTNGEHKIVASMRDASNLIAVRHRGVHLENNNV